MELELSVEKAITIMSWCSVERRLRNQRVNAATCSAFVLHFINFAVKLRIKQLGFCEIDLMYVISNQTLFSLNRMVEQR